ncbi:hypothetical protein FOZ61_010341 [Perkinsus olseni]|uniref:Uncharacterized protein n=1 Tax=Perkinsus olseni TaxID=32597 RepID=A0A7J6KYC5_PEROL|nr:hypothetical protein FOZ61_010341 [Perkinsus olseni]KAF4660681.1 hypothetical protein FOL46_006053 [Perkinsus olseni]
MMILRLIASALPFFPLVNGNCKARPALTSASPQRSSLGQALSLTAYRVPGVNDDSYKHIGYFVYEPKGPGLVEMVFVGLPGDVGLFSVKCEHASYHSSWFRLRPNGIDKDIIHVVPEEGLEFSEYENWIVRTEAACPGGAIQKHDLTVFYATEAGDVQAIIGGVIVTLNRTWLPLIPGLYSTGDSSKFGVQMQYNISIDGTVAVELGCAGGGVTGFKKYKLVGTGLGNHYEVKPTVDGDTLEDLVGSLEAACPGVSGDEVLAETYQTVGFATEGVIFVTGNFYEGNILRRQFP